MIEGENYHALKALQIANIKVDIIYIDPPYNTGNEFIYNDNYVTENKIVGKDDPHKHSKWLSFMKRRLELAQQLLNDDGIIFISIDDNEQAYLKVLMDEIFDEENFVCNFIWQHKSGGGQDETNVSVEHEYITSYGKNKLSIFLNKIETRIEKNEYNKIFDNKNCKYIPLVKWGAGSNQGFSSLRYPIIDNENKKYYPLKPDGSEGRWRKKPENCEYIIWIKNKKGINTPYEIEFKNNDNKYINERSILFNEIVGTTSNGTQILKKIFNHSNFPYPKPPSLISYLIKMINKKNATILDFFAGSGTTGQAVMELNEDDGGNRRFILVTNNENNIARDICRERLFRVIKGHGSANEKIEWEYSNEKKSLQNNSLRYLKIKKIDKVNGQYEDINSMKKLYWEEFHKDISIKDFSD